MNRYHLVHVTEFHYDGSVSESYNEVRLRPLHDEKQSCLSFRLATSPASENTAYRDVYGNWVHQFNVLREHRHLRVEAESVVLAHDPAPNGAAPPTLSEFDAQAAQELAEEYFDFVSPTTYVPHLPALQSLGEAAEAAGGGSVAGFARAASGLIHERFRYMKGATHVQSSLEDCLALGAGVCQDFAHLLLGVARTRGLPARYVSGYLVPQRTAEPGASLEEVIGGQASHAWTEIYVPHTGWMGFDPTLGASAGLRHVRIAYGRDYGDVAPVRGVYKGRAGQRLSVDVRVRPALGNDGHERMERATACPVDPLPAERAQQPAQQQ